MGTNFYYRKRSASGEVEEKHIGKKSSGWQFMFRAHKGEDGKIEIGSWQQWKETLTRAKAGKIFDEYDDEWGIDSFVAMIETCKPEKNHVELVGFGDGTWNDPEGFSFSLAEFC